MTNVGNYPRISTSLLVFFPLFAMLAAAQEKKEFSYTVGFKATISITNHYGPITVKPSGNRHVLVTATPHSDAVSFVNEQHGNRIELQAVSSRQGTNLVDYTVLVPDDAFVSLQSSDGSLSAQGLRGDVILESATASVEVTDISGAHLHVRTLSGPITLTDIRNSHLEVHSVSGNISLHKVTESSAEVHSGSGRVTYEGDPGRTGDYLFTTHTGNLDVSIPASAPVEIKSHSLKGASDSGSVDSRDTSTIGQGNLLLKPGRLSTSRFVLRSFKGMIRVKRPD
jgi:DUF4097 and DUF4098 domain-containing protein YvlB